MSNLDNIARYLGDVASQYGAYHQHKETSAWAGVALFVTLIIWLLNTSSKHTSYSLVIRCGFSTVIVLLLLAFIVYLRQQFRARKRAADIVAACLSLRAEIIGQDSPTINRSDYLPPNRGDTESQSSHVISKAVLDRADQLAGLGQEARRRLELAAYAIVVIVVGFAIAALWVF